MQKMVLSLAMVGMLIMVVFTVIGAQDSRLLSSSLYSYPILDDDGVEIEPAKAIPGTRSSYVATSESATMRITTQGLTPGEAVTSWWIIFNHPEFCSDGECGRDDVLPAPGNESAGVSVLWGDGVVVEDDGTAYFWDVLEVGDASNVNFGPGLTNPFGAEVHYVLRSHGPARQDVLEEQLSTINGGCDPEPPHEPCYDAQFSILKDSE